MASVSYGRRVTDLAEQAPDAPAFVCEERVLSRGALERDANRRARAYAQLGVKPGALVSPPAAQRLRVAPELPGDLEARRRAEPALRAPAESASATRSSTRADPALIVGLDAGEADGRP